MRFATVLDWSKICLRFQMFTIPIIIFIPITHYLGITGWQKISLNENENEYENGMGKYETELEGVWSNPSSTHSSKG